MRKFLLGLALVIGCTAPMPAEDNRDIRSVEVFPVPVTWSTVAKGYYGPMSEDSRISTKIIFDQTELSVLRENFARTETLPEISVDFTKNLIVVVSMGTQMTGGYDITITDVKELVFPITEDSFYQQTPTDPHLLIELSTSNPSAGGFTTQAVTSPYHIIQVPNFPKKPILELSVLGE